MVPKLSPATSIRQACSTRPAASAWAWPPSAPAPVIPSYCNEEIDTLYIDCLPLEGGDIVNLSRLIAEAKEQLGFEEDYRLTEERGYGRAAGILCDAVQSLIVGGVSSDIVCFSRLQEHKDCLAMLQGLAGRTIKGSF